MKVFNVLVTLPNVLVNFNKLWQCHVTTITVTSSQIFGEYKDVKTVYIWGVKRLWCAKSDLRSRKRSNVGNCFLICDEVWHFPVGLLTSSEKV